MEARVRLIQVRLKVSREAKTKSLSNLAIHLNAIRQSSKFYVRKVS